jgi:hypothetical protein
VPAAHGVWLARHCPSAELWLYREDGYILVLNSGAAAVGLAMVSSAFLFWQELRANRQEIRAVRQESREISVDEGEEWTPRAWLYATAFGLSFFLAW